MLVLVLGCVFLILIIPLAALAAVARTSMAGLALAAALLACGAGWFWLMVGWLVPDLVANTVLLLVVLTPALILAGRLADRVAVVWIGPPSGVRLIAGHWLAAVCVCLNVLVLAVLVVAVNYFGWSYTPPSSDALPLPAGLTVVSDQNQGCSGDVLDSCVREIDVTSSDRLSPDQTAQVVIGDLTRLHGWPGLGHDQESCRYEGWLLGREDICVEVQTSQNAVRVLLGSGP